MKYFGDAYRGKRVLVTGHTGFKGSWLCQWLAELGANVFGYSLPSQTNPNHFELLSLDITQEIGDIRDSDRVKNAMNEFQPEIVFHLAAQPLVRRSYRNPTETMSTNVLGTQCVYQACLNCDSVKAVVSITSDKVYQNAESNNGYRESDRIGGADPYSCSKACVELLTDCYRQSFASEQNSGRKPRFVTARAGNVIGGGDWAEDRIIADAVRAAAHGETLTIRNPHAIRPWQHVLEPLAGYLLLGQHLLQKEEVLSDAWNFGPDSSSEVPVESLVRAFAGTWNALSYKIQSEANAPRETNILKLNSVKAITQLEWLPLWDWKTAVQRTANWYKSFYTSDKTMTLADLKAYQELAADRKSVWVST